MLSMLLLLAAAPQTTIPPMPPAPVPGAQATMRVLGQPSAGCAPAATQVNEPNPGGGLLWREGRDGVGHYLLLDRYVGGCPAPLVTNYRVPGSNAVGREASRTPSSSLVIVPRR